MYCLALTFFHPFPDTNTTQAVGAVFKLLQLIVMPYSLNRTVLQMQTLFLRSVRS